MGWLVSKFPPSAIASLLMESPFDAKDCSCVATAHAVPDTDGMLASSSKITCIRFAIVMGS